MAIERRSTARQRLLLTGIIIHGPFEFTADCAVRNLTATGAHIILKSPLVVAKPIVLLVVSQGKAFKADKTWSKGKEIGLSGLHEIDLNDTSDSTAALARRLLTARLAR